MKKALEAVAVRVAIENATESDIAELKTIINKLEISFGDQEALAAIDGDFHRKIAEIADNPVLNESLERIQSQLTRLWYYVSRGVLLYEEFHQDYVRIVDAIERKDAASAEAIAISHVDVYNQQLRRELI